MKRKNFSTCLALCIGISMTAYNTVYMPPVTADPGDPGAGPKVGIANKNLNGNPSAAGFQITVTTNQATYMAGYPINLTVTINNIAGTDRWLPVTGMNEPLQQFDFTVTYGGKPVPLTAFGQRMPKRIDISQMGVSAGFMGSYLLHPGDVDTNTFVLNRLFDMSLAGTYVVSVKRPQAYFIGRKENNQLDSAPISATVNEPLLSAYDPVHF